MKLIRNNLASPKYFARPYGSTKVVCPVVFLTKHAAILAGICITT